MRPNDESDAPLAVERGAPGLARSGPIRGCLFDPAEGRAALSISGPSHSPSSHPLPDRPRTWFGVSRPAIAADTRISASKANGAVMDEKFTKRSEDWIPCSKDSRSWLEIDRRIAGSERRCVFESREITIAHDSSAGLQTDSPLRRAAPRSSRRR
jgi:hypothetical protein